MSLLVFSGNTKQENFYGSIIARFLGESDLLPHVYLQGGVNTLQYNIPTAYSSDVVQDYRSTPSTANGTTGGTITFKDRKVSLGKWMAYETFFPGDLKQYWSPFAPTGTFEFQTLPAPAQSIMIDLVLNKAKSHMSKIGIKGDTSLTNDMKYFDGFEKIAKNDSLIYKVTGITATSNTTVITKANILSEMFRAIRQSRSNSDSFRIASYRPTFKIFVSYKTFELYGEALRGLSTTNQALMYQDATPNRVAGIQLVPQAYVSDNTFLFAEGSNSPSSNMWFVVNDIGDDRSLKVDKLANNSEDFFMKLVLSGGVQFARPEEVSIYKGA